MKAQLFTDSDTCLNFRSIQEAMNYARFRNIKQYCVLLIDDSGFSLYDSLRAKWSFPETEKLAHRTIGSLLN